MVDLNYDYGQIDMQAMQLKGFVAELDQRLSNDVDKQFQHLCDAKLLVGQAATAFYSAKDRWHTITINMGTTLTDLHGALNKSSTDMGAMDQSLVSLFG
jgi:uncharacterized protein YukE